MNEPSLSGTEAQPGVGPGNLGGEGGSPHSLTAPAGKAISGARQEPPLRALAFFGPAFLVCVGYMDPGNWATDLAGGSRFGYRLLWVLLLSNGIALMLQTLSARLGLVTGKTLAEHCREAYSRRVAIALWIFAEVAIVACDLAELLGGAIALQLLFGLSLPLALLITAFDVMLVLALAGRGFRLIEAVIFVLIATIGGCYLVEILIVRPGWPDVARGLVTPVLPSGSLFIAIGIIGATVMPHNLYLHSDLVRTRIPEASRYGLRPALRHLFWDTAIALNFAFLVNAAILIMAAGVFHRSDAAVTEIEQAYRTLSPLLVRLGGSSFAAAIAPLLFAVALFASGQASSITGTLAGQSVMEGFLRWKISPILRRLVTRAIAIVPALAVVFWRGQEELTALLIFSQVVLSFQLPFAMVPLVRFAGSRRLMGDLVLSGARKLAVWAAVLLVIGLNVFLLLQVAGVIRD